MGKIIKYFHHGPGVPISVDSDLKGKHREHCLCWQCGLFYPEDREKNCPIASTLYALNVLLNIVTPVWECPEFVQDRSPIGKDK